LQARGRLLYSQVGMKISTKDHITICGLLEIATDLNTHFVLELFWRQVIVSDL
jgi:hypothetical protein